MPVVVPTLVWLGTILLSYPSGKQAIFVGASFVVGMMLPNWVIALIRRPYQTALRRGIPDALDLMVVCAEAGLGLESAVERVAQEMNQSNRPVGVEFSLLTHEMRIMPDRRIALTNLAERTGQPALKRLAGTIAQTLKYGTPLSQGLRTLAAEMRDERMIQFEERAGKLPALLVMPMMLFILPCLFIIILGKPASQLMGVFAAMKSLSGNWLDRLRIPEFEMMACKIRQSASELFRRLSSDWRGVSAVEFAVIAPVMVALIVPIADIGQAVITYISTYQSLRDAAAFALVNTPPDLTADLTAYYQNKVPTWPSGISVYACRDTVCPQPIRRRLPR